MAGISKKRSVEGQQVDSDFPVSFGRRPLRGVIHLHNVVFHHCGVAGRRDRRNDPSLAEGEPTRIILPRGKRPHTRPRRTRKGALYTIKVQRGIGSPRVLAQKRVEGGGKTRDDQIDGNRSTQTCFSGVRGCGRHGDILCQPTVPSGHGENPCRGDRNGPGASGDCPTRESRISRGKLGIQIHRVRRAGIRTRHQSNRERPRTGGLRLPDRQAEERQKREDSSKCLRHLIADSVQD